jgi:hypothetical protein
VAGNILIAHRHILEFGTEAAQFPEKEYIFVAVHPLLFKCKIIQGCAIPCLHPRHSSQADLHENEYVPHKIIIYFMMCGSSQLTDDRQLYKKHFNKLFSHNWRVNSEIGNDL